MTKHRPDVPRTLTGLVPWPLPWGACSSDQPSSQWRNLSLMSNLMFPWSSFIPFPRVLSPVTRERRSVPHPPLPSLRKV